VLTILMGFKFEEMAIFTQKESPKNAICQAVFKVLNFDPYIPAVMLQVCRTSRKDDSTWPASDAETLVDLAV